MDTHCKIIALYSVESALIFGTIDLVDGLVGGGVNSTSFSKNNQVTIRAKGREGVVKNSCLCMRDERHLSLQTSLITTEIKKILFYSV